MMEQIIAHLPMVAKYGASGLAVIGLVAFAMFAPAIVPSWPRTAALVVAGAIATWVFAYSMGVRDEHRAGVAIWNEKVDKEIESGKKDRAVTDAGVDRAGDDGLRDDPDNRLRGTGRK